MERVQILESKKIQTMKYAQTSLHIPHLSIQPKTAPGSTDYPLTIAVVGHQGSGKSSFINALVGHHFDSVHLPPPPRHYKFSDVSALSFLETDDIKKSWKDVVKCDLIFILSSETFEPAQVELSEEIKNERIFFVRTKTDTDLQGEKRNFPTTFDAMTVLSALRQRHNDLQAYLVSSLEPNEYDFSLLIKGVLDKLPTARREQFIYSLQIPNSYAIQAKYDCLCKRIPNVANTASADFITAKSVLLNEVFLYQKQLGLDQLSLANLSKLSGKVIESLKIHLPQKTSWEGLTASVEDIVLRMKFVQLNNNQFLMDKSKRADEIATKLGELLDSLKDNSLLILEKAFEDTESGINGH